MVLSVLFTAGAVPLSFDDQTYPTTTSSATATTSSAGQSTNIEYVHYLEELVGELSGVFATWVHQNPPPSSPTSLADMYHQRANTCNRSTGKIKVWKKTVYFSRFFQLLYEIIRPLRDCN